MKKILIALLLGCMFTTSFAQRKQIDKDYYKAPVEQLPNCVMPGKIKYSYIVGETGETLKDGPLSIKCGFTNKKFSASPYVVTYNGNFTLNTSYSKGNLNGAFTSNYKLNAALTNMFGTKKQDMSFTMSGGFANGLPNGAFKIVRNGETKASLSANYKNGILVGPFNCTLLDDDSRLAKYSGTLSQDGKLTGAWNINDAKITFQNNVLISETTDEFSTRPAVVELAKKYAEGTITKEELAEKNIIVRTDSMLLGDYVRIAVFRDSGVEFKELGGYDFSIPNNIKYELFEELITLTDEGAKVLGDQVNKMMDKDHSNDNFNAMFWEGPTQSKYGCLKYDDIYKRYYILMTKESQSAFINSQYITGTFKQRTEKVYLTEMQLKEINDIADKYLCETPTRLIDIIYKDVKFDSRNYLEGKTNFNLNTLKAIKTDLNAAYEKFQKESTTHKTNENIILWGENMEIGTEYYISKSSVSSFELVLKNLDNKIESIIAEQKAEKEAKEAAARKAREEAQLAECKKNLSNIFDFMIKCGKANKVVKSGSFSYNFINSQEIPERDIIKMLTPFCPVVNYEILKATDNNTIICKITQQDKKKGAMTYEIELKYEKTNTAWYLDIESFDINKATLIKE